MTTKTSFNMKATCLLAIAIIFTTTSFALAKEGVKDYKKSKNMHGMFNGINLTEVQKNKIEVINKKYLPQEEAISKKFNTQRAKHISLIVNSDATYKNLLAMKKQTRDLTEAKIKLYEAKHLAIINLLDKDQKIIFYNKVSQMLMHKKGNKRKMMMHKKGNDCNFCNRKSK